MCFMWQSSSAGLSLKFLIVPKIPALSQKLAKSVPMDHLLSQLVKQNGDPERLFFIIDPRHDISDNLTF